MPISSYVSHSIICTWHTSHQNISWDYNAQKRNLSIEKEVTYSYESINPTQHNPSKARDFFLEIAKI